MLRREYDRVGDRWVFVAGAGAGAREFGRIVAGVVFPGHGQGGFVAVLGEDLRPDPVLGERHVRLLFECDEWQGAAFSQARPVLDACVDLRERYFIERINGVASDVRQDLGMVNAELAKDRRPRLVVMCPPGHGRRDFEFYARLVQRRTWAQKTLHLGLGARLSAQLQSLPRIVHDLRFEDYPAATALFWALSGLDLMQSGEGARWSQAGPADGGSGY